MGTHNITYKNRLDIIRPDLAKEWSIKNKIKVNEVAINSNKIGLWQCINHNAISLGTNCSVNIRNINNEICLEIMPNETTDFLGDVVGVTVKVDENNFCVKSVMGMANNAKKVVESKKKQETN